MRASVEVKRLSADKSGLSRFDTIEIAREMTAFAPPAEPFLVSAPAAAIRFVVLQLPVGFDGAEHVSPARQILFCRSGVARVTPGVGAPVLIGPGDAWLMEDTTGSGHKTEVVSHEPFEAVVIQLPD